MTTLAAITRRRDGPAAGSTAVRSRVLTALGLLGVLLTAFVGWLTLRRVYRPSPLLDGWLPGGFELVVAGLCMARGLMRQPGRAVAVMLGAGLFSWGLGDTLWTARAARGAVVPSLPLTQAFWLGFYPFAYVAVVLLVRREARRDAEFSWLDGIIAALGAAAVCTAFVFQRVLPALNGSTVAQAINLGFPIGDVLLFALFVGGTTLVSRRLTAPWVVLAAGMVVNIVGDTFNLFGPSLSTPRVEAIFHTLAWPVAGLLVSVAVWLPARPPKLTATDRGAGFLLPGIAAASALVLLSIATLHHVSQAALGLSVATLIVVGVRLALTVRELRTLTEDRLADSITDELTGLRNRRHLFGLLDRVAGDQSERGVPGSELAFLFLDLNNFKEVNDSFGHSAGDELLRQLGPRLTSVLGPSELLVRIGGDEFGIVLADADADRASVVAQRVMASLREPFVLDGVSARVSASIGSATMPTDSTDRAGLLRCADAAMYRAKVARTSFAVYDAGLDDGGNRLRLVDELRVAVEEQRFDLHYQAQLDLHGAGISAVEALLRWPHPRLGSIPPDKFIPLAEQAGLMAPLTGFVLDTALAQCAAWRAQGHDLPVSVNVSPTNLLDSGFTDMVCQLLARHRLPPEMLVLEVTETSIIANFEAAKRVIEEMRDLGLVVSIDDFGAGHTSLAYLAGLAVGELKLDGIFITGLAGGDRDRDLQLVRATIELGHTMGLRVVAECIEDKATLQLLTDLGCDYGQGYFIGRPVPADEILLAPGGRERARAST